MDPEFPLEFIVYGTPVSLQRRNPKAREEWKRLVAEAARNVLPDMHFASAKLLSVTLFYFPDAPMEGDIDNIVKLTLDGMCKLVYLDDRQVERVVVQKFEPGRVLPFSDPSPALAACAVGQKPALYVRLSVDLQEDFKV